MSNELPILHVTDARAGGNMAVAVLNHVAIERANSLASRVVALPNLTPSDYSWRYRRLHRLFQHTFTSAADVRGKLAFVYGPDLLEPLHAAVGGIAPAGNVIVLAETSAQHGKATDKLRATGWTGTARLLTDRLVVPYRGTSSDGAFGIAITPQVALSPPPAEPGVGLCYLGRSLLHDDCAFLRRLAIECGLPLVVMVEEADRDRLARIDPGIIPVVRKKNSWPEFFLHAGVFIEDQPNALKLRLTSPMGRAIQHGRPVFHLGDSQIAPGVLSLASDDELIALLRTLKEPHVYQTIVEQSAAHLSIVQGEKWHLERLHRLSLPGHRTCPPAGPSDRSADRPHRNAPVGQIASYLVAVAPGEAIAWLAVGSDVAKFRRVLESLSKSQKGMTVAALAFALNHIESTDRPDVRPELAFWLCFHAAEWLLENGLGQSALSILQSLAANPGEVRTTSKERRKIRQRLALALSQAGRQDEAADVLRELIVENSKSWWPPFQLGRWLASERPGDALELLESAVRLAPNPTPAILVAELANALLRLGRDDEALLHLGKSLETHREARPLMLALANVHLARGDKSGWASTLLRLLRRDSASTVSVELEADRPLLDRFVSVSTPSVAAAMPLVGVIMTAYNAQDTIATSIASVLAQTHGNLRLAVVDDASTDRTLEIVRRIAAKDPRVVVLQQPGNQGPYAAKNRALSLVAADYYTFHDADDWMHPGRVARHLAFMKENPSVVCSYSSWIRLDPAGHVASAERENPASSFFSRAILDEMGAFDMVRVGADREFRDRLRRRYGEPCVVLLEDVLGIGLKTEASLTSAGPTGFDDYNFNAPRLRYKEAYWRWFLSLGSANQLHLPYPQYHRAFPAPAEMTVSVEPNPHPFADRDVDAAAPVNAIVVHWPVTPAVLRNWGDKLNPELVTLLSDRPAVNSLDPKRDPDSPAHLVIGSGLAFTSTSSVVWGSGFIAGDQIPREVAARICAVRGPLTRNRLLELGIGCPEVYGDPALLYPLFYLPKVERRFDIGVIQHCREAGVVPLPSFAPGLNVRLIDIQGGLHEVVDAILSCRRIVSSSLHGIIAAHAYGVPATWVRFSQRPKGDGFKFRDYWASVGSFDVVPAPWEPEEPLSASGGNLVPGDMALDLYALLRACPFISAERQEELVARAKTLRRRLPLESVLNRHVGVSREG